MEKSILAIEPQLRPASPAVDIKDCDAALFPNISILLQTACRISVTSCECERSASISRRLNNCMLAPMLKDRSSHLVFLHIHYTTPLDLDTVVDCYARLHPRRLQLENLLQYSEDICLQTLTSFSITRVKMTRAYGWQKSFRAGQILCAQTNFQHDFREVSILEFTSNFDSAAFS